MEESISKFHPRQTMIKKSYEIYHYKEQYFKSPDFHSHDFFEFYFFLDGSVTYYIEEGIYQLIPGDLLMIPPGKMHRPVITDRNAVYERIVLWMNLSHTGFSEDFYVQTMEILNSAGVELLYLLHLEEPERTDLVRLLRELIQATNTQSKEYASERLAKCYLTILLILVCRILMREQAKEIPDQKPELIPEIITYINANLPEELSLEQISKKFYISKYHLIRMFKKYTLTTVGDYIAAKRINLAKKRLSEGVSSGEVCTLCGFREYSSFYRAFKKKTGLSPNEYRKRFAKAPPKKFRGISE